MADNVYVDDMKIPVTLEEYRITHAEAKKVAVEIWLAKRIKAGQLKQRTTVLLVSMKSKLMAGQRLADAELGRYAGATYSYTAEIQEIDDELKTRPTHQ